MALWEMCHRKSPYAGISSGELYARQQQQERPIIDDSAVPEKLREVIRACWQFDPSERPTASNIVDTLREISTLENKSRLSEQRTEEKKEEEASGAEVYYKKKKRRS